MRLVVTTPTALVVDQDQVRYVRAEDETGAFGVLPGHADFLTVLAVSVITWREEDGSEHHVAVRGGVLTVRDGAHVEVATREAVGEETLERLGSAVLSRLREEATAETESRVSTARLHLATIRQLQRFLESGRQTAARGGPPNLEPGGPRRSAPEEGALP
jgi:F-type H+-transporting ATPase subunit epsilon